MKGLGSQPRNSPWRAAIAAAAGLLLALLTVALMAGPWRGKSQPLPLAANRVVERVGPALGAAAPPAVVALQTAVGPQHGAAAVCRQPAGTTQLPEPGRTTPAAYEDIAERPAQVAPPATAEHFKLRRAITILTLLREVGLNSAQWDNWEKVFRATAHGVVLRPGHLVELDKEPGGQLRSLRYDLDDSSSVVERSLGGGVVVAARKPLTYLPHTVTCSLALRPNLTDARANLPPTIMDRLGNIFGAHLHAGAFLKLVYSEFVTPDGTHSKDADLKAAEIKTGHQELQAFSFRDQGGYEHLYDAQGRQLGPQFLRYPVKFQYISSTFSAARYHPILHIYRPHVGVDLAARYGTPVKAAGDGTVEFAGWAGELGHCVRIKHNNGLTSVYGHLSGISSAARPGAMVRIGQVIGWVGASGLATGPHLHYALYEEGHFLNPLTVKLDQTAAIPSDRMALFNRFKNRWDGELAKLPNVTTPPAAGVTDKLAGTVADRDEHPDLPLAIAKPIGPGTLTASADSPVHSRHHHPRYRRHFRHHHASAAASGGANDSASM